MNKLFRLNEISELLKSEKSVKIIMIAGAVIILVIALSGLFGGGTSEAKDGYSRAELAEYEKSLERRLSDILTEIEGIGTVRVMVTLDTAEQTEYGKNEDMLISLKTPQVRGVIVVCDGGGNPTIREKVINAVAGVFGIATTRISVTC